jgi:hypothetical protein
MSLILGEKRMVKRTKKKSNIRKVILIALAVVLAGAVVAAGVLWNRYLNKNSLIERFETPQGQELYLLGAFHKDHFKQWARYSMEDLLSAVQAVQPDVVFIEAREASFQDYGVIDGPIDMAVVYSYCMENAIPVELIDWWVVDNDFQANSTNDKRDDHIFENIDRKLQELPADTRVLVVCGTGHFYEQAGRFLEHGFEKQGLKNRAAYFDSKGEAFAYPVGTTEVWEKRAYFYAYTLPEIISQDEALAPEIKAQFTEGDHDAFYQQQLSYCVLFAKNALYE